ncbi:ABC transporter substrate-binding protein [Paenibacillus daejeonensis]|uniref:ABC transporter substrate-binding protein n=1 Tax=Paenibacillus daejeonensis TaxID=135193 RepID=UPI00035CB409|nr:ABC transporter substrate-binding protein [Paenibacillus daejeonensis]
MRRTKWGWQGTMVLTLLLALLLQGCSGGPANNEPVNAGTNNPPAASGTEEPPATGAEAEELEPYEVSIVYFGTPQRDDALVEEKINEYLKEKINTTVDLRPIASSEYKQKTELMLNTGEAVDLMFTASWLGFTSNVTKGAFLELDELLDQHGQGIKETIHPLYLEAPRYKGKLYAVPTNKEITQGLSLTYRKDIVDKYSIPIEDINTMDDLEPWFELLKEKEPQLILNYVAGGGDNLMYETKSNYRPIGPTPEKMTLFLYDYTSTGDVEVKSVLDPEIVDINKKEYELYRKYYEKGYINSDAATTTTNVSDLRKQGKIWMQRAVWKPGADIELKIATDNQYDFVSHVVEEPIVTTDLATGSMMSIARTSKNPERAMMVLNYLHTDPYLINLIVNGIEDQHYKKVGDNRIEPIADSGYGSTALFWVIGNQLLNYLKPGQPDDLYTGWQEFNDNATRSPLLGFVFDDASVKNELSQLVAIINEYKTISSGAIPNPSQLIDERNTKFKAAGIEKVQAEVQKQIDAWFAEK